MTAHSSHHSLVQISEATRQKLNEQRLNLALVGALLVSPILVLKILEQGNEPASAIGTLMSAFATTFAFGALVITIKQQQEQLRLQRTELALQRATLMETAKATFSQFYLSFYDHHVTVLNRHARRLIMAVGAPVDDAKLEELDVLERKGDIDPHIDYLIQMTDLRTKLSRALAGPSAPIVHSAISRYVRAFAGLRKGLHMFDATDDVKLLYESLVEGSAPHQLSVALAEFHAELTPV